MAREVKCWVMDRQTHATTTVTVAVHVLRRFIQVFLKLPHFPFLQVHAVVLIPWKSRYSRAVLGISVLLFEGFL